MPGLNDTDPNVVRRIQAAMALTDVFVMVESLRIVPAVREFLIRISSQLHRPREAMPQLIVLHNIGILRKTDTRK